jgi:uncharacterized protein (DUF427 family)
MSYPPPKPLPALPGQLSVWDFPRPAIVEPEPATLRVEFSGIVLAQTTAGYRTLETSHPPTYYFPPADVRLDLLRPSSRTTVCEWKGQAKYHDVVCGGKRAPNAAWSYPRPATSFDCMAGFFAFYPGTMDQCTVNGERAVAQPGPFYAGWITSGYAGPFKGVSGSEGW